MLAPGLLRARSDFDAPDQYVLLRSGILRRCQPESNPNIFERDRADFTEILSELPSSWLDTAYVVNDIQGHKTMGSFNQAEGRHPRNASLAL